MCSEKQRKARLSFAFPSLIRNFADKIKARIMSSLVKFCLSAFVLGAFAVCSRAQVVNLWPERLPVGVCLKSGKMVQDEGRDKITRIRQMPVPTLEKWKAKRDNKDKVMIVCPGGGYSVLAVDLEGTEIAQWLNSLGYTAYVLRYRVPNDREGALQDAQRAIRMVRAQNPGKKVGIMGFSAGADLSCRAATSWNENTYGLVDETDSLSARPDYVGLVYPAYLDGGDNHSVTPSLNVNESTPPMFVFQTADDGYGYSSLAIAAALKNHKVPVELHIYPRGGHGYGLREKRAEAAAIWPVLMEKWMEKL